jgi:phosphatidylserine decarboxylase
MQFKVKFNILLQHLVPQHGLSRLAGWIANNRWHWLKNKLINDFIRRYQVDLSIAKLEKVDDYPNFNSFFTRQLKPLYRPITEGHDHIASPVDGCVSQAGKINQYSLFQAKGRTYNLNELLGGRTDLAKHFEDGEFTTLYLAPKDYHRVHMPLKGKLTETIYIPGKLFSVNQDTTKSVAQLFSRNERLVCMFDTEKGPMAVILVGAMLVSGIETVWPSNFYTRTLLQKTFEKGVSLEKGAELGHFKMGSTVILLFPKNTTTWVPELKEDATVKMGSLIGHIKI